MARVQIWERPVCDFDDDERPCPECKGDGWDDDDAPCLTCGGDGYI